MTWAGFVKTAYKSARDWGIQPTEFWLLSPQEWWWEFDFRLKASKQSRIGLGGYSEAEWDEAREAHREKMKARNG